MAADKSPEIAIGEAGAGATSPVPRVLVVAALTYALLLGGLALRSRVYIDEIWLIEWGRILLDPQSDHSMYMFVDGSSFRMFISNGLVLTDWLFRTFESVAAFRLLNVAAMLLLVLAVRGLASAHGVPLHLAGLLALALLFDPSLAQSVVLGRPDALAMALAVSGLWLADHGTRRLSQRSPGWWPIALGYSLCVFALSIWISVMLLGPLIFAHWLGHGVRLRRLGLPVGQLFLCFLLVPIAMLLLSVDLPQAWAVRQAHAVDPLFPSWTLATELWRVPELVAISCFLVLPGVLAVPFLRPRWLVPIFVVAYFPIVLGGFYPFRIPYLLIYAVAAIVLVVAHTHSAPSLQAWRRLLLAAIAASLALLAVRVGFGLINEPRPPATETFVARLPAGTRVADFSWDFYESGRLGGQHMMRSYPSMDSARVQRWFEHARPDLVIRAVDSRGTWIMVEDIDEILRATGYCESGWVDINGETWARDRRARPVPTPLLWRLGLYRDPGPYAVWVRCPASQT